MPRMRLPLCALSVILATVATAAMAAPADPARELSGDRLVPNGLWLEDIDLSASQSQFAKRRSIKQTPIRIAGVPYSHGVGGGGRSELLLSLGGSALRFSAMVGIDDVEKSNGSLAFEIWVDGRKVRDTGRMVKGEVRLLSVDLTGATDFALVVAHGGEGTDWERFGLGGAHFVLAPNARRRPEVLRLTPEPAAAIAPPDRSPTPRINGPAVVGGTPGRAFLFLVPATGQAPLTFSATGLPAGLTLDARTGIIAGKVPPEGRHVVNLTVKGPRGRATKKLTIVASRDRAALAPTPPMGWNSWNVWGMEIDGAKIRAAADALVSTGLAAHGFRYVNIDDGWQGKRNAAGELQPDQRFGDVRALADYVHGKGLKLGIYSSPGPETCGKRAGSHEHEQQDARTWAAWGVDFLKYDWCSYDRIVKDWSLAEVQKPFRVMQAALQAVDRDVVYSLCQYGRGDVWTWGAEVGGNLWRTTSDITDVWPSLDGIGFSQAGKEAFAGPGGWNDPDMLIVGHLGWGEHVRPTRLDRNEQILHLTHWALLAAPLLIGADLGKLDEFTLALLTNDEVIEVDQDELGKQAARRATQGRTEVWSRPLADGTTAVGLYNRGPRRAKVVARWPDLALVGPQPVRDLWQRKPLGTFDGAFETEVPQHGAVMLKIGKPRR